jgi:hypothetical protein
MTSEARNYLDAVSPEQTVAVPLAHPNPDRSSGGATLVFRLRVADGFPAVTQAR